MTDFSRLVAPVQLVDLSVGDSVYDGVVPHLGTGSIAERLGRVITNHLAAKGDVIGTGTMNAVLKRITELPDCIWRNEPVRPAVPVHALVVGLKVL